MNRILALALLICFLAFFSACTRTERATLSLPTVTPTESTLQPSDTPQPVTSTRTATITLTATRRPPTLTPTETLTPSRTPTATRRFWTPTPTFTPTNTATLDPSRVILRFAGIGPMSKLSSPFNLVFYVQREYTGTTRIEIIGEDGREIYRKVFRTFYQSIPSRVSEEIRFEIPAASEIARIQISTQDELGRIMALNSVRVLLMSVGDSQFTPPYELIERVVLRFPRWEGEVTGGEVRVVGMIRPFNNGPVILELVDQRGAVIASRLLYFDAAINEFQHFETSLLYRIAEDTPARIVLRQNDDRIPGPAYIYSHEILLKP
jgi:hypothetical protein